MTTTPPDKPGEAAGPQTEGAASPTDFTIEDMRESGFKSARNTPGTDDVWAGANKPFLAGEGTALPVFDDARMLQELDMEGPPEWLGTRWRDITDPAQKKEAWIGLRAWVDWFIREYCLNEAIVPPCWFQHSNIVVELYAAMCAEYKVWEEGAPGLAPMTTWNMHVIIMSGRLREIKKGLRCSSQQGHQEESGYGDATPFVLAYDQDQWAKVRDGQTHTITVPRESETDSYWRPRAQAVVKGKESTALGDVIRIAPTQPATALVVSEVTVASSPEARNIMLECTVRGTANADVSWQVSHDGHTWEEYQGEPDEELEAMES